MAEKSQLLSRDEFREGVFKRDNFKCVNCGMPGQDAHHVVERRLFVDPGEEGGYFLDNGVTVCGPCHMLAEQTILSCDELRRKAGIANVVLPGHFYLDQPIDKWGNLIRENGTRSRGELFDDESVQKVLRSGNVIHLYTDYVKYPRTHHLPYSPNMTTDDKLIPDIHQFDNEEVDVRLKLDGENTTMYHDYIHARSLDSDNHPSRNRVKAIHAEIAYDIPQGWRICGENVYAKHSIHYTDLDSYLYIFSIWNEKNVCLSVDETEEYSALFDLPMPQQLYRGVYNPDVIMKAFSPYADFHEGFVVRKVGAFPYKDFRFNVAKYVRKNHVRSTHMWALQPIVPNELKETIHS